MHFTRMSSYTDHDVPVIVRGSGAYVYDQQGKRYLDGLSGLFVSQVGHGRTELAAAAASRPSNSPTSRCGPTPPNAIELAERLAALAPGDLNRVFFTTGGSEAVESAWKLARNYFKLTGEPTRYKVISRDIAYHGTSMGALSITGLADIKPMFEPLVPGSVRVPNTNFYRAPLFGDSIGDFGRWAADEIERAILREGPSTVAAVYLEPVQNSGGASRRRPATSSGSARSATSTASCWSPTRSSAPSAGSATTSAVSGTATSPTSSPSPRA